MEKFERLNEIRARCKTASSSPWFNGKYSVNDSNGMPICCQFTDDNDKNFIAHARKDIPYLLSEVDRLTQGIKDIGKECERRYDKIKHLTAELELYQNIFDNPAQAQYILSEYQKHKEAERDGQILNPVELAEIAMMQIEWKKYKDAEEQGRLVVLPCKVRDTVYYPFAGEALLKQVICFITKGHTTIAFFDEELTEGCDVEDFGKAVFLTKSATEKALHEKGECNG